MTPEALLEQPTPEQIFEQNLANQKTVKFTQGQRTITIQELSKEVMHTKMNYRDYLVPADKIRAEVTDDDVPKFVLTLNLSKLDEAGNDVLQFKDFELTEWAHGQLADKCKIPKQYYDRCRAENELDLLQHNVNTWLHRNGSRRIRTVDNKIRAIVSDRFAPIDNWVAAEEFLKAIEKHHLDLNRDIHACSISDTHMHIRAIVPHMREDVMAGDTLIQGLMLTNSEVGASSFKLEPFLWRLKCKNGLIGPDALTRIHLGSRTNAGEFDFSDDVKGLEQALIQKQVQEIVHKTFDETAFHEWIAQLRGTTERSIPNVVECVNNVASEFNLKSVKDSILNRLAQEGPTQYGLVNALTDMAKDYPTFEGQIEIERIAGQISMMDEKRFRQIATV